MFKQVFIHSFRKQLEGNELEPDARNLQAFVSKLLLCLINFEQFQHSE